MFKSILIPKQESVESLFSDIIGADLLLKLICAIYWEDVPQWLSSVLLIGQYVLPLLGLLDMHKA